MAKSRNKLLRPALFVLAIGLISFGLWGFWQKHQATNNPAPTIPAEVVTYSTDRPDETPPHCDDSYVVPANQPRKIELPGLGISGCIQPVGTDQDNRIAVPTNIHVAGWFVDSVKPGESGVSIIGGHVQGLYDKGIFKYLGDLETEDTVRVEFGDDSTREFKVVTTDRYSVEQAGHEQFKQLATVDKQLTLITCGGNFNRDSQQYDERIIVRAKLHE